MNGADNGADRIHPMKRVVVLISGRGSNLQAILEAVAAGELRVQVAAVLADRETAAGLQVAAAHGVPTQVIAYRAFAQRSDFDAALGQALQALAPDAVVLAGFMRILGDALVRRWEGRMFNIHPSLLPAFPGLHTHRRALEAGCQVAGATVHLVTPELDHGPIVAQAVVPVAADDTEDSLAARVLQAEHRLYPRVLGWWADGQLSLQDGRIHHRAGVSRALGWADSEFTPSQ